MEIVEEVESGLRDVKKHFMRTSQLVGLGAGIAERTSSHTKFDREDGPRIHTRFENP